MVEQASHPLAAGPSPQPRMVDEEAAEPGDLPTIGISVLALRDWATRIKACATVGVPYNLQLIPVRFVRLTSAGTRCGFITPFYAPGVPQRHSAKRGWGVHLDAPPGSASGSA